MRARELANSTFSEMYICKTLVKQGVALVGGSRRKRGTSRTFETSTSATTAPLPLYSMRTLAKSFPKFQAVPYGAQMRDWKSARLTLGASLARSTSSIAVSSPRSALDGVEARENPAGGGEESVNRFDVSSNCVTPVFRVSPFVQKPSDLENTKVRVLFLSEGNVCRSVYAEAIFNSLIEEHGMQEFVECASKASKDYNAGESPDPRAVAVAEEIGLKLPEGAAASVFECQADIVVFDLLVVMDKFNASDVLKEVTVYEAIDKGARYTQKVRRLAEFCRTKKMEDIDDPLYYNMGGPEELALLRESYEDIRASCIGLMQTLVEIKASLQESETLKLGVAKSLGEMETLDWLVPPMLQKAETLFN